MSALTAKITREHEFRWVGDVMGRGCMCGESFDFVPVDCTASAAYAAHIAAVTEAAVREQVARDIETARAAAPAWVDERHLSAWTAALASAARIARGGAA